MMIEEQIENEKKAVELLHGSMKKTNNKVIRLLLYQLVLDSTKHKHMLRVILQLLESPSKEQFRREGEEFRKIIERHVEVERKMLENFERIVDKTDDNRIRFILQDIISDEKRHHAIMKRVHELVCESEKVKDEKWWDFLFRYSRLTG
jgi:rubrerythrin